MAISASRLSLLAAVAIMVVWGANFAVTLPAFLAAPLAQVPAGVWLGVVWAVGVSSFLGWLVWSWVNAVRGLARSAPLQYLMPPIAGVVAWWMLGEKFTALKLGGAATGPPDPG
jgi:drug/metabolite transporter (DMT)-like permease